MKLLLVATLAGVVFLASANSVCNQCQEVVQSFLKLSKDQTKIASMKRSLSSVCPKSKFSQECAVIAENLDTIVLKLSPYLKDSNSFCSQFHMCSGSRFDGISGIALAFAQRYLSQMDGAKDSVCNDCQAAAQEILGIVADSQTQAQIYGMFDHFCSQLGQYQQDCTTTVTLVLDSLFKELQTMLENNQQFCADLKLCAASHRLTANEVKNKLHGPKYVQNLMKSLRALKTPEPHNLAMSCSECQLLVGALLDALKTANGTQMLSDNLVHLVMCDILLPKEWGCDDFVATYGTTVVYMTLEQFDSEGLCEDLTMCTADTGSSDIAKHSKSVLLSQKCSSCKTLSSFMLKEMKKPKAKTEIVYGLQSNFCKDSPQFLQNICESFFGGLLPGVYDQFMHFLNNEQSCETIKAC